MSKKKILASAGLAAAILLSALTVLHLGREREASFSRCMNIGNALDAPRGVKWDVEMKAAYFDRIKEAGFDCVRLPVRFSDYAKDEPNYTLQEPFMNEIDAYLQHALDLGLYVILDFHHFTEIMEQPEAYKECFISVWRQLSIRYKDYPDKLVFEVLNEPQGNLRGELWNRYLAEAVQTIRMADKERTIIAGPDQYNSIDGLERLSLPDDKHIMLSIHFYEPNRFTFQGNPYHKGFEELKDIEWGGTPEELRTLRERFATVQEWAKERHVRVFMGEFGVNRNAPEPSRILWTSSVRSLAEEMGFAWGYWELASGFGIWDDRTMRWDGRMLDALLGRPSGP